MAEVAVAILLEQVKEVVKGHVDLISGAENEFDQLQNELGLLKAFLKDAAKKKKEEHLFRALEERIREVVYEVEDTIDTCLTRAIEGKAKNSRGLLSKKKYDLAKEVKLIREQKVLPMFDEAKANFAMMEVAGVSEATPDQRSILMTDKPISQNKVVGFEDEEEKIVKILLEENENRLDVIPIIGIPGQGKTTLTWKIYENEAICYHFPIRIWLCISQKFDTRDVFLQILRKFAPSQDMSKLEFHEIVKAVATCLENEKFLLVLDDLWTVDDWELLKAVLPLNNGKSKVLITSREMAVGNRTNTRGEPHKLRFLTSEESWTLLQYQVFGNLDDCPQEFISTGKLVAKKCDGVPLTIIVVGGILLDQLSQQPTTEDIIKEWMTMATNMTNDIPFSERITKTVELSYNRLPDDLRDCFVYLGVFPEDYQIPVDMLFRLWIAEGLVLPRDDDKSLEQCAEENLKDLIARNLLKPEKTNHMGKVKTIRVHDIIRDFCIAINDNEKIFKEIKKSNPTEERSAQNPHRLCIRSSLSDFLSENPKSNSVHSILYFCEEPTKVDPSLINVIPDGFPNMRVLESESVTFDQFPRKVAKLIHVRYLTLFIDDTINKTYIPSAISELWNLQTLTVHTKTRTIEIKLNIWRMIRLRHLKTRAVLVLDDKHVGGEGNNLQTLDRLSAESCTEAVSKRAKNLKTLGVYGNLAKVLGAKFLENLERLEKLKLVNTHDEPLVFPPASCFPPYLKSLTLRKTYLEWEQMSVLAKIQTLEVLKLKNKAFQGTNWNVSGYNFSRLQLLLIHDTDVVIWETTEDSFPELRFLVVKSCQSLMEIPSCFGMGTHLEKLEIEHLSTPAVESAKAIQEAKMRNTTQGRRAVQFVLKW